MLRPTPRIVKPAVGVGLGRNRPGWQFTWLMPEEIGPDGFIEGHIGAAGDDRLHALEGP